MGEARIKIDKWMSERIITKIAISHVCLSFVYGMFLFLYELKFLRELVPVIHPFLIAWAGILIAYDFLVRDYWNKMPYYRLLALFSVVTGITAIVTREAGLVANIKTCILIAIPLYVFLPVCMEDTKEKRFHSLVKTLLGPAIVMFGASVISVYLYLIRFSQIVSFMGIETLLGYRYYVPSDPKSGLILYGVYTDTNHAATYALAFAAYSIVLYSACGKEMFKSKVVSIMLRVFAVLNLVIQLLYFPLANSRGGWLCIAVATMAIAFLYCCGGRYIGDKKGKKIIKSIAVACVCVVAVVGGLIGIRTVMSNASVKVSQMIAEKEEVSKVNNKGNNKGNKKEDSEDTFKKEDVNYIGGGRLEIWKETIALYKERPILGTGAGNNQYYSVTYGMEGSRLARGAAVHNSYLNLLLDYGIVGFSILMLFFVISAVKVIKGIFDKKEIKNNNYFFILFAVTIVAGASALLSCTFINTTAMYYLLLVMLGYLLYDNIY